ncbi:MAG: hydroxyacid dehydrogenase [Thermodesulfovibrionales bacterium]
MRIAFFEIREWEKKYLRKKLRSHTLDFFAGPLDNGSVPKGKDAEILSVFIYSKVNAAVLRAMSRLKLVATRSTGFDHIDMQECRRRSITVATVPFYGENTVAEHTFALILALSRNIHKAYVKSLRYDFSIEGLKGFDLKGRTLGVVGAGGIGLNVIRIAKGFAMDVLVYDTHPNKVISEALGFCYGSFEEVLGRSDIITLHVPYNKNTHHLINKGNIHAIKKGAILINTARGSVVETEALLEALDKKILAGAGLDVLEGEELIKEEKQLLYDTGKLESLGKIVKDHILLSRDNVVFTPHIAFYSQEALERILETTVHNILAFLAGTPQNVIRGEG